MTKTELKQAINEKLLPEIFSNGLSLSISRFQEEWDKEVKRLFENGEISNAQFKSWSKCVWKARRGHGALFANDGE